MKPERPVARKQDYFLSPCEHSVATALVREHHYAKSAANTGVSFCAAREGKVRAAAMFLPPLPPAAEYIAERAAERGLSVAPSQVVSLSRLVVIPGEPQNVASMLVAYALRAFRKSKKYRAVVTFADTAEGHTGQVYRAMNAEYLGKTKPEPYWVDAENTRVSRKATQSRTVSQMRSLGYERKVSPGKHRFVWWLT